MHRGTHTKMCQGNILLKGEKFDISLIYPPTGERYNSAFGLLQSFVEKKITDQIAWVASFIKNSFNLRQLALCEFGI